MPDESTTGRLSRRRRAACVILMALWANALNVHQPAYATVVTDVRADADWIMSARLPDGAIANYIDKQAIWPYLSNFAAMGLARATEVTKNTAYVKAAWNWLSWYRSHMDSRGFVSDYIVQNGQPVSTGFMDSTDSYAATFLMAIRDTYRADKNLTKLKALRTGVTAAVKAMEATQDTDGLTWAKPEWRVKYLMDQSEVYAGFLAGAELAKIYGDTALRNRATTDATRVKNGVAALWDTSTAAYDWAVHGDATHVRTNWSYIYPDALQQVWAVAFGLVPTTRAAQLVTRFITTQPAWANPTGTALFSGDPQPVGYWPLVGLALHRVGNLSFAAATTSIRTTASLQSRPWPYTTATAGQLILLESVGLAGARTLDAQAVRTVLNTARRIAPMTSITTRSTPGASSPTTTSSPPTSAPSPSPAPLIDVGQNVGPVTADVTVGRDGASVSVGATPMPKNEEP